MIELTQEELKQHFSEPIFGQISETADALGLECYVVGGYVRDIFLQRPSKDIDVVVGSCIAMAEALGKRLGRGAHVSVFKNFGTAQVKCHGTEVEFVGARKESYQRDSRKPIVEDGTLEDDQNRRDFTINALAVCLNKGRFGELVDPFQRFVGQHDYFIKIFPSGLDGVVFNSPLVQEQSLPESAVVPVAATGGDDGFVGSESVQVVDSPTRSLQSLTVTITAYVGIKRSYRIEIYFRDRIVDILFR